jgi:hypothetical protein
MPLSVEQEEREHQLRVLQMETNIDKLRSDLRYEGRKFAVQLVVGAAACVGVGIAIANYVNSRPPQVVQQIPAPPPQIIILRDRSDLPGPAPSPVPPAK